MLKCLAVSLPVTNGQHAPALGYLIDGKIAYIKAAGVLSDEARQALQEAKPSIAILGCNVTRAGTFLPSILKLFDEKCRVFLVDIGMLSTKLVLVDLTYVFRSRQDSPGCSEHGTS